MALAIITSVNENGQDGSNVICKLVSFLGDAAYPTGGTPGFAASLSAAIGRGNLTILAVVPQDCGLHAPVYDAANDKLKVIVGSTGLEVAPGDQSAITYNLLCICE